MADNSSTNLFDFAVNGEVRVIAFIKNEHVSEGVNADVYTFADDKTHILMIYTVEKDMKTLHSPVTDGHVVVEGYLKGKGTLIVTLETGAKDTYYFENAGHTKEVTVRSGQSVQWVAPHDSQLVFYEMLEVPPPPPAPPLPKLPKSTTKLFLSSAKMNDAQAAELAKLAGKKPADILIGLIENAADVETGPKPWMAEYRKAMEDHGFDVEVIDLHKYSHDHIGLLQKLQQKNVIWLGGGNTFYLRWLLQATRAEEIIKKLISKGTIYGGSSAGAIVAGPTLKFFEAADDLHQAPEVVVPGLNLTKLVIIPHMDNQKYADTMKNVLNNLVHANYKVVPLNDNQAMVIDGDDQRLI